MKLKGRTARIDFDLETQEVDASKLLRIGRRLSGEPYFGKLGDGRYSDTSCPPGFGTCYTAFELTAAIAETMIRDELPVAGEFHLSPNKVELFYVHELGADEPLNIVDFTGPLLRRLGIHSADLQSPTELSHAQAWAKELHDYSDEIDGIEYLSRQVNTLRAVALFCRSKRRGLRVARSSKLGAHRAFPEAIDGLKLRIG